MDQKPCLDVYSEESGELTGESTADGGERVTPFENQPEKIQIFFNFHAQRKKYSNVIFYVVETDEDRDSCSHEPTLRDPPCNESFDGEPVLQGTGFEDKKNVKQEEATSTSTSSCECYKRYRI